MNEELLEIIKKFNGFHPDMLYDEIITLNKTSNFNDKEFVKFLVTYTLIMGILEKSRNNGTHQSRKNK